MSGILSTLTRSLSLSKGGPESSKSASGAGGDGGLERANIQGYLYKRRVKGGTVSWQMRYYVLFDHAVVYYDSNRGTDTPARGSIPIYPDSKVELYEEAAYTPFCLQLSSPRTKTIILSCTSPSERDGWITELNKCITNHGKTIMHGALRKKTGGLMGWGERYYVLRDDALTGHESVSTTHWVRERVPLTPKTNIGRNQTALTFHIVTAGEEPKKGVIFKCDNEETWKKWSTVLTRRILALKGVRGVSSAAASGFGSSGRGLVTRSDSAAIDDMQAVQEAEAEMQALVEAEEEAEQEAVVPEKVLHEGELETRPLDGNEDWKPHHYVLTDSALKQYTSAADKSADPLAVYSLNVNCTVFETNLRPCSFQLVTSGKVLHAQGLDKEDTAVWTSAMRGCISRCELDPRDVLCREAAKREDDWYEVCFTEKKPLGVVLERSGDWALVKMTHGKDSGIKTGSALSSINDKSLILEDYSTVTQLLSGWQAPLKLGFRKSPSMSGWLNKQSTTRRTNFKPRFFALEGGHLMYYQTEAQGADVKGDIKLMGCSVSLLPHDEVGYPFCFRLISGLTLLTMQAKTHEDMLNWAVTLYHAVAIANGGGYLLTMERKKLEQKPVFDEQQLQALALATPDGVPQPRDVLPPMPPVMDDGDSSDEEDGDVQEPSSPLARSPVPAGVTADSLIAVAAVTTVAGQASNSTGLGSLTDDHIETAFNSLNLSGDVKIMRPVNFSMFIRLVTGKQNLFFEMDTFHKFFDIENNGVVNLAEFQAGVHRLEENCPTHPVIIGLRTFVADALMSI